MQRLLKLDRQGGAGEMVWLPKCLLHKLRDLKPDPEHVQKARHCGTCPEPQCQGLSLDTEWTLASVADSPSKSKVQGYRMSEEDV